YLQNFNEFVSLYDGTTDSGTECEYRFYFDISVKQLEPALDHFVQFFIDHPPLIMKDAITREREVIEHVARWCYPLTGKHNYFEYNPEAIQECLNFLTPETMNIMNFDDDLDLGTTYFKTYYSITALPKERIEYWKSIESLPDFNLSLVNAFLMDNISLIPVSAEISSVKVHDDHILEICFALLDIHCNVLKYLLIDELYQQFVSRRGLSTCMYSKSVLDLNENRLSRWQMVQHITESFFGDLDPLQQRSKWRVVQRLTKVGQIVLVRNFLTSPNQWELGRITACRPGDDDLTCVVTVKSRSFRVQAINCETLCSTRRSISKSLKIPSRA
ncbi:NRDC protein, partial [Acromyrmex heyeri]